MLKTVDSPDTGNNSLINDRHVSLPTIHVDPDHKLGVFVPVAAPPVPRPQLRSSPLQTQVMPPPQISHEIDGSPAPSGDVFIAAMEKRVRALAAPSPSTAPTTPKVEPFVPKLPQKTESDRLLESRSRDRVWAAEYAVELILLLVGFNIVPILYYCLVQKPPVDPPTYSTGVNVLDYWTRHLTAPARYFNYWTDGSRVPQMITAPLAKYPATFVLVGSLLVVVYTMLNKSNILAAFSNLTRLQASPFVHAAIAWSWYTTAFELTVVNVLNWVMNFVGSFLCLVILVIFSHLSAAVAQGGLLMVAGYVLFGIDKWRTTGEFKVHLPDPFSPTPAPDAGVSGGGGLFSPSDLVSRDCANPANLHSIWERINQNAYLVHGYAQEVVLVLFAIVKTTNSNMQTPGGKAAAYATNALVASGALVSLLFKMSAVRDNVVPVHLPL